MNNVKITQHTNQTVRVTAEEGWHFVRILDDHNMGNQIYENIETRLSDKYRLEMDNYLKPFNE